MKRSIIALERSTAASEPAIVSSTAFSRLNSHAQRRVLNVHPSRPQPGVGWPLAYTHTHTHTTGSAFLSTKVSEQRRPIDVDMFHSQNLIPIPCARCVRACVQKTS